MDETPIACTLSAGDASRQVDEWAELRRSLVATRRIDGGVEMTFPVAMADVVDDLAAREAACCAFLDLRTSRSDDDVVLSITSDQPDAAPVIELLAGDGTQRVEITRRPG